MNTVCPHCKMNLNYEPPPSGSVKNAKEGNEGCGCVLMIVGLCMSAAFIGIPLLIWGIIMYFSGPKMSLECANCGYTFDAPMKEPFWKNDFFKGFWEGFNRPFGK